MSRGCDVAIIGSGPYGLSIAAHLGALGVDFRVFGRPMHTWLNHMPQGMKLKSEGFASNLYDAQSTFTLETYCKAKGLPYADSGLPVRLETFTAYGLEFQKRFVPTLENSLAVGLKQTGDGYQVRLDTGEEFAAKSVVVAVGLSYYEYVPPILAALPATHLTHSARYNTVDQFRGRDVAIIGAGASALDLAALMNQADARVQVIARTPAIRFYDPPGAISSFMQRVREPQTVIGHGWKHYLCANMPHVFRQMPEQFRLEKVKQMLGPGPGWFIKDDVVGKVPLHLGQTIGDAKVNGDGVRLRLVDRAGGERTVEVEHVIAATGYRVDLRRLRFLDAEDLRQIRSVEHTPVLSSNFESSLPGLYFVGTSAANSFGPLMRFAAGAKFTARRISRHLSKSVGRTQ